MNSLKDLEETLNKCSRCGLCQAVCPIYQLTKNECTSPKGKCILLNNLIKSKNKPSKEIIKYFKTCSNCGKCIDFCTGDIDITKINFLFFKCYNKIPLFMKVFKNIFILFLKIKEQILNKNIRIQGKIAYIKPYSQKDIPEKIKKYNPDVIDSPGCDLDFIINNPDLSKQLAEETVKNIINKSYDTLITDNILCKFQLESGFKALNINKKIKYLS